MQSSKNNINNDNDNDNDNNDNDNDNDNDNVNDTDKDNVVSDQQYEKEHSKDSSNTEVTETKGTPIATADTVHRMIFFGTIILSAIISLFYLSLLIVFVSYVFIDGRDRVDRDSVPIKAQAIVFCVLHSILPAIVTAYNHNIHHTILVKDDNDDDNDNNNDNNNNNGGTTVTQVKSAIATRIIIHILLWTAGTFPIIYIVLGANYFFGTDYRNLIVGVSTLALISTLYHSLLFYLANRSIAETFTTSSPTESAAKKNADERNSSVQINSRTKDNDLTMV